MGGAKAATPLAGRPMITYPLAALAAVLTDVAVLAKAGSALPELPAGIARWSEPDEPRHPLAGITAALRAAHGRAVLVLACDLPLVTPELVRALAAARAGDAPAVVTRADGRLQPLCARYEPAALAALERFDPDGRTVEQVKALRPALLDVDAALLRNVNDALDLADAEATMRGRTA